MPKCPRDPGVFVVSSWFFTCENINILWKCLSGLCIFLNWVSKISKRFHQRPSGKKEKKWRRFSTATSFQLEKLLETPKQNWGLKPSKQNPGVTIFPQQKWVLGDENPLNLPWFVGDLEGRWIQLPCGACRRRMRSPSRPSRRCRRVLDHRTGEHKKTNQTKNQEIHQGFFFIKAESYMSNLICFGIAYWWCVERKILQWSMGKWYRG